MINDLIYETQSTEGDWLLGRANARVTILEYADFTCPYSAMARPVLESLVDEYPDSIHLLYRHFPTTNRHRESALAAEAAEAAGAQGRFWQMHDTLFAHQDQLQFENLRSFARLIHLDGEQFVHDLMAHRYRDKVQRDLLSGLQNGVKGTPSLFINGQRYEGLIDRASVLAAVAAQLHSAA
jgi:formate-nitrite transporter family protein